MSLQCRTSSTLSSAFLMPEEHLLFPLKCCRWDFFESNLQPALVRTPSVQLHFQSHSNYFHHLKVKNILNPGYSNLREYDFSDIGFQVQPPLWRQSIMISFSPPTSCLKIFIIAVCCCISEQNIDPYTALKGLTPHRAPPTSVELKGKIKAAFQTIFMRIPLHRVTISSRNKF